MKKLLTLTIGLLIAGSGFADSVNVIGGMGLLNAGSWWKVVSITEITSPTHGTQSHFGMMAGDDSVANRMFVATIEANGEWNVVNIRLSPDYPYFTPREFRVNADLSMDFRNTEPAKEVEYANCVPQTNNGFTNLADGTIIRFYAFVDPNHVGGSAGPAGADGADGAAGADGADSTVAGPTGATGATGGQGEQGKLGPAGADAPCIDCVDLSPALIDFACKILAANPPTSQEAFDDCVDAILGALTATTNVCGDKSACLAQIKADIDALK
jgi:hypothetical protein